MLYEDGEYSTTRRTLTASAVLLRRLHLDGPLLAALAAVAAFGLFVLYSATGENFAQWLRQVEYLVLALVTLVALAQVPPAWLRRVSPLLYALGIVLLVVVAVHGTVGKGAQRWLTVGPVRFQPSEIMKLAVPMMCAWYLHERPLPPTLRDVLVLLAIVAAPAALIAKQPDLGTALLVASAGILVLFLAGMSVVVILAGVAALGAAVPVAWHFMHDYQRQRVLTFLDPAQDPLGAGYHSIQSQIAIGSGGVFGKGWMNGSQAQLEFLPERSTDFIFAVIGEELGLLGQLFLLGLYLTVIGRALYLASETQDTYGRLVCGSFALTFFVYAFVNSGMVSGILPVVGVPLPLVSYGGTAMVTLLASFGVLMSLNRHRKLVGA
ncbi:MAG TPA: rod shape-determining protein RodA [Steroidobacteraceae bacterium]|nr:rod shape-determining protein RodA [Steroidobacteraceae bacterium]